MSSEPMQDFRRVAFERVCSVHTSTIAILAGALAPTLPLKLFRSAQ